MMGAHDGRFAPSPTGELHVGNLRTALVAWLFARHGGGRFLVRMEDLDLANAAPEHEAAQCRDLRLLGLDWDGEVVRQSERFAHYRDAIATLQNLGLVYPCYCTRREIREASRAPHGDSLEGRYPGTCRALTTKQRSAFERAGRPAALRLRGDDTPIDFVDQLAGPQRGVVDDVVLCRNDGVPAYNLAVVIDDDAQGIGEVVRGDDLLATTVRQIHVLRLLGRPVPSYAHVPLVMAPDGVRLAKRHGAVTLAELSGRGIDANAVRAILAASLGLAGDGEAVRTDELLARFAPARLSRQRFVWIDPPGSGERHR